MSDTTERAKALMQSLKTGTLGARAVAHRTFVSKAVPVMAALVAENDALRARIAAALNLCRDEVRAALSEETPNAD